LSSTSKINLLVSEVVYDEFTRNRDSVIADAIQQFKKTKLELHRPNIIRPHAESVELEHLQGRVKDLTRTIVERVTAEAVAGKTMADQVVQELFDSTKIHKVAPTIINLAINRHSLGRPPGKKDSIGDAVHWEWLLGCVPKNQDLHLISRDGDFESTLSEGTVDSYLLAEWSNRKSSLCHLHRSLESFFRQHFSDIQLADQLEKETAIEKLEQSSNFSTTHNAIARLSQFDDFTADELRRLISAYVSNNQISWILGDKDVKDFAYKLVTMANSNDLWDLAFPIEVSLSELDSEKNP
jgi:hypothetical protein